MPTDTSLAGGVTIASNWRDGGVRVSVTRTYEPEAIDEATLEWVKGQNWYCFDTTCKATLSHFTLWPKAILSSIKHVTLTRTMMASDDLDNYAYANDLGRKLREEVILDSVTLAVPHDKGLLNIKSDEYEWWMWTLHKGTIDGFKERRIATVRFLFQRRFTAVKDAKSFQLYGEIQDLVLQQEHEDWLHECIRARDEGWYDDTVMEKTREEYFRHLWEQLEYVIDIDKEREGENGTVLILRHKQS